MRDRGVWSPVLMLTARDAVEDRVAGLDLGADDYLVKPFALAELHARLRSLVRRGRPERPTVLRVGDLSLDPARREVRRGDVPIDLSAKEFALLEALMRRPGEVATRLELIEQGWDFAYEAQSNVIDVYIGRLRRKLDEPFGSRLARNCPRCRLPPAGRALMNRLPIRVRVAAGFAAAMAFVLAATGLFLYVRLGNDLARSLDQDLRLRAQDLSALVSDPRGSLARQSAGALIERGESFAQLLDHRGDVLDATPPLGSTPLLAPAQIAFAEHRDRFFDRPSVPGLDEQARLLALPAQRGGRRLVLVVGATLENRAEALSGLRTELLVALPAALLLATLTGTGSPAAGCARSRRCADARPRSPPNEPTNACRCPARQTSSENWVRR